MIDAWIEATLFSFLLILARVGAFIVALPVLGGRATPHLVKATIVLTLSMFWFSVLGDRLMAEFVDLPEKTRWFGFSVAIGREVALGAIMGFALGLFMIPFRVAGEFIGQEMGLTLGGITDPTQSRSGNAIGQAFEIVGILILFALDVHHVFFAMLHSTFARRPVGQTIFPIRVDGFIEATTETHQWGLMLSAPVAVCLFLTSITLALLARAAPQLNILSIGFSLRLFVGLIAVFLMFPDIARGMIMMLERYSEYMYTLL